MDRKLLKDGLLWGFLLWLIGYILGIVIFMVGLADYIGLILTPLGSLITLWVLFKKIKSSSFIHFVEIGVIWMLLAITLDYFLLVKLFNPENYYQLHIYLYYGLTLFLPLIVGWWKTQKTAVKKGEDDEK